jgi:hypothetical protein
MDAIYDAMLIECIASLDSQHALISHSRQTSDPESGQVAAGRTWLSA